ncbi:MAG: cell division protein FtsX [bacterium]
MTALRYLFGSTWKNLTENRLMNLVSVGSIGLALMIIGSLLLLQQNTSDLLHRLKSQTSIVVYLEQGVDESRRRDLESKLIANDAVKDLKFRSKQEARQIMQQRLGEDAIKGLSENPFPPSFHLKLKPSRLKEIESVASKISGWSGIEEVDYGKEHVERLENLSRIAQILLGSIGIVICVVAVFVIFNTIQLTVVSRKDEIDILKLVGATKSFIGFPFVLGGAVQGLLGCVFGSTLLWFLYWIVQGRISALEFFPLTPSFLNYWRLSLVALVGLILGVIGSATAVRRSVSDM